MWQQIYDPAGNPLLSTLLAALPVIVLLGALGFFKMQAHMAALLGLATALAIAVFVFHMPAAMAGKSAFWAASMACCRLAGLSSMSSSFTSSRTAPAAFRFYRTASRASPTTDGCNSCW